MSLVTRTYSFANGGTADGGQVDSEIQNLVNTLNNVDTGTTALTTPKFGATTFTGSITFSPTTKGLVGTTAGDNATAGNNGEYTSSIIVQGSAISAVSNNAYFDITNLVLTAGDWDITGLVGFTLNGATVTVATAGIGTVSGNDQTGLSIGDTQLYTLPPSSVSDTSVSIANVRKTISGSVTYYLKAAFAYSAGTPKAYGRISARRIR